MLNCSREVCSGGNVSRAATLEVLHRLRPTASVTICLPLFLAGDEAEREFARNSFKPQLMDATSSVPLRARRSIAVNQPWR
ncbi:MAG: hypothetical protein JSW61_08200 [Candidatus Thorarchaeota archaeon]|nr:MAG: hypothetical protein JSW61_08200 [Candidatus Thorarchaeota archaeon]